MLQNIQAVIVDLDGTMIDTLGDFEVALNRMLADFSLPSVDRAFVKAAIGKGSEHLIGSTLEFVRNRRIIPVNTALSATKLVAISEALASNQAHYLACNGEAAVVYAGVMEGLQALRKRRVKALWSV